MNSSFSGANLNNIKDMNYSAVLNTIYGNRGISRTDIAVATEMSCAFVTKVLSRLTALDIVLESKTSVTDRGRPKVSLEFNYRKYVMAGLRINTKYVSAALCTANGEMLCHYSCDLDTEDKGEIIYQKCVKVLKDALSNTDKQILLGIGIAVPGPVPIERDRVTATSFNRLRDFEKIPLVKRLEEEFLLPVTLLHDAQCGALTEYLFGEGEKYNNIVFITSDTGVGAGIILDGKPYSGSAGLAGEVSKMIIGEDGKFIPVDSVLAYTSLMSECGFETIEEVIDEAKKGNLKCLDYIDKTIRYLSVVVANLIPILSPQAVILSEKIAMYPERLEKISNEMLDSLLPELYRDSFELIVRPYTKHLVLRGACGAVLHKAFEEPSKYFSV